MPHSTGTAILLSALKEVWAGGDTQETRGDGQESSKMLLGEVGGGPLEKAFLAWASHMP